MKYFGTDGIRGVYPLEIDEKLAYKTGRALGQLFGGKCVVGQDSRTSGGALKDGLISGLNASSVTIFDAGIVPTPAISFLTRKMELNFGVMISASHNPPEFNGIKVFARGGVKLSPATELAIEFLIDSGYRAPKSSWNKKSQKIDRIDDYMQFLVKNGADMSGIEVNLDCGFGAAGNLARDAFLALNAKVNAHNNTFDGQKINLECGAACPEFITQFDNLGFAFDGDADRMICSINKNILDGDSALFTFSRDIKLKDDVVVGTIMANSALEAALNSDGKKLIRTDVGDKNICLMLKKNGYNLGGEQSGHYIFYPDCVSGDGILSAIKLAKCYLENKITRLELVFQKTISLPLTIDEQQLKKVESLHKSALNRLIIRKSGTEPSLRIMAEGDEFAVTQALAAFRALEQNNELKEKL